MNAEVRYTVSLTRSGFSVLYEGANRDFHPLPAAVLRHRLPERLWPRGDGFYSARHVAREAARMLAEGER